jgi:uncharacterized protein
VTNTDPNGNTPLHLSSANGHSGTVSPALCLSVIPAEQTEIVKRLLKYPQSISPQNNAGNTPLHWACLNNHVDTAKLLIQEGADMFVKNVVGRDAIWEAEQRENEELVGWMLAFGEEREVGEVTEQDADEMEDIQMESADTKDTVNGSNGLLEKTGDKAT